MTRLTIGGTLVLTLPVLLWMIEKSSTNGSSVLTRSGNGAFPDNPRDNPRRGVR